MAVARRFISATGTSVSTVTATFAESGALGTDSLLFAVVMTTDSAVTISSSWGTTQLAGGGNNGSTMQLQAFAFRGDGSTNSVTITTSAAVAVLRVDLYAFAGYVSLTPNQVLGQSIASGTTATIGPASATTVANTIAIAAVALGGSSGGFNSFSNGFESVGTTTGARGTTGVYANTASGATPSTTLTWTTARAGRSGIWLMQGTTAGDTTPPTVAITSPANNSTVSGTINIAATATDASGIASVKAYFTDTLIGNMTNSTGSTYVLNGADTSQVPDGQYVLTVTATDTAGNVASAKSTITVQNQVVPPVTPPSTLLLGGGTGVTSVYVGTSKVDRIYIGANQVFGTTPPQQGGGGSGGGATTPTPVAFFGPNGTHWPSNTPVRGATFDSVVEVACTPAAISTALTNAQTNFPNGKVKILVQPGSLTGNGAGSSNTGMIQSKGSPSRATNILVTPRDGWGTVTGAGAGIAFVDCNGISFVGFDFANDAVLIRNCQNFALGWTRARYLNTTANAGSGCVNIQFVECVLTEVLNSNTDRTGVRTVSGYSVNGIQWIGCYWAPSYRNDSSSHTDTIQFSGGAVIDNALLKDCAAFTSSSECVIGGPVNKLDYDKTLIVAGTRGLARYPQPNGTVAINNPVALNGSTAHSTAKNCYFLGSIVPAHTWDSVVNTITPTATGSTPASGAFTVDSSYVNLDPTWLDSNCPIPDSSRLASIWAW